MRTAAAAFVLLVIAAGALAGCGGDADADELKDLRRRAEFAVSYPEHEAILTEALAIASRDAGKPLGDEAFAFAEQSFLGWYYGATRGFFEERVAAPPAGVEDEYLGPFRRLAGFILARPPSYEPAATRATLRAKLNERARFYLFRLDLSLENRRQWIAALQGAGTTELNFIGQQRERDFADYVASLRYLRTIAAGAGETGGFLEAWDRLIATVIVADFSPPTLGTKVVDGVIVTTYSAAALAAGVENVERLAVAVAASRADFPKAEAR